MSAKCESALVRLCHNTLTHSAHTTHTAQPVYLYPWVDIPAFCLLVTAPSAHHTTPHHTTPHHTTPHHTTPHHTTPHHTTPHHTTPHHTTPHHTTPHHTLSTPQPKTHGLGAGCEAPKRQGLGTALRRCTNSVGCTRALALSTTPSEHAPPSTDPLGPGNRSRAAGWLPTQHNTTQQHHTHNMPQYIVHNSEDE